MLWFAFMVQIKVCVSRGKQNRVCKTEAIQCTWTKWVWKGSKTDESQWDLQIYSSRFRLFVALNDTVHFIYLGRQTLARTTTNLIHSKHLNTCRRCCVLSSSCTCKRACRQRGCKWVIKEKLVAFLCMSKAGDSRMVQLLLLLNVGKWTQDTLRGVRSVNNLTRVCEGVRSHSLILHLNGKKNHVCMDVMSARDKERQGGCCQSYCN